jgi:hypothetical protein
MSIYTRYAVIALGAIIPFVLQILTVHGLAPIITLLLPSFIVAIFLKLVDLDNTFKHAAKFLDRVGEHNIREDLDNFLDGLRRIDAKNDKLFCKYAIDILKDSTRKLDTAAGGIIEISGDIELTTLPTDLMRDFKSTLDATLIWSDDTLVGARGQLYRELMVDAITNRKVTVRRLFVLTEAQVGDKAVQQRMKNDCSVGVQVRYILDKDWQHKDGEDQGGPADFGIWDGKRVWVYGLKQATRRSAYISVNAVDIEKYKNVFHVNWLYGTPFLP